MSESDASADALDAALAEIWAVGRHDPISAALACKSALKRFPDAQALWAIQGRLFLKGRAYDKAALALERALQLAPWDAQARVALAAVRLAQGLPMTALQVLDGMPSSSQAFQRVAPRAALLRMDAGDFGGAVEALASQATHSPQLEQARAAAAADQALGLGRNDKLAFIAATEALVREDPAGAEAIFAELVARAPGYGPAWVGLRGAILAQEKADPGFAGAPEAVRPLLARKPGGRGLVFDPRDTFAARPRDELLKEAPSTAGLIAGSDVWLTLDPGGVATEFAPTIPCGGPADGVRLAYETAETFVAAMAGAAVAGRGVVIDRSGVLVAELEPPASPDKFWARREASGVRFDTELFRDGVCPIRTFEEPALLMVGPTDGAFGDWMVNFLPRLVMARQAGLDVPLLVSASARPFVRQTLAFLGYGDDRILEHDPHGLSVLDRLYVPSWPLPHRRQATAGLLRGLEVAAATGGGPRRIYLSREDMRARRLVNEADVRARFEARGFVAVHPERLALDELHALLSSASHVAGPYGSAFLNLAFCQEKPACLVCAPAYYGGFLREITLWLGSMDARFGLVLGEPGDSGRLRENPWTLDPDRLDAAIDRLLEAG